MARLLGRGAALGRAGAPIPPTVRSVLGRRLGLLSPACLELLRVAAVAGDAAGIEAVEAVLGIGRIDTLARVDEGERAGLVALDAFGGLRFSHALVADVLRADAPGSSGSACTPAWPGGSSSAGRVARPSRPPWWRTTGCRRRPAAPPSPERARPRLRLRSTGAAGPPRRPPTGWPTSRPWPTSPTRSAVLDAEPEAGDRVAVLLALADARLAAGDQPGSRVALLEAAAGARARGDRASLVRAALGLGGAGFEVPAADAPAIDLLREALDALDPADPTGAGTRALLLSRLSVSLSYGVPVAERQELSATAVALALGLG